MKVETFHRRLVSLDLLEYKILDFSSSACVATKKRPAVICSEVEKTFSMFYSRKAI